MPQTKTAETPEVGMLAIERLLSAISETESLGYNPEPVERCKHYINVGVIEDDWIRKQVALRWKLLARMDVLTEELRAEGASPDPVKIAEYEEASFMATVLIDMIVVDLKLLYPELNKAKEGIDIDADWNVGYADHSLENYLKTLVGELPNESAKNSLKEFLGEVLTLPEGLREALRRAGAKVEVYRVGGDSRWSRSIFGPSSPFE